LCLGTLHGCELCGPACAGMPQTARCGSLA